MKRLVLILLLFAGHLSVLRGEPFEQAEVTKAINVVSLLPQDVRAGPGDIVEGDTALQTGGYSRAELQFPDLTITRIGSNSLFRFVTGTREIILDSGTMLFSAPTGAGGGTVRAGVISAAVTGSDFMISNVGRVRVICLSHKVTVYLTANPKIRAQLHPGQMLDIAAGVDRKLPRATTINLGKLLATSKLTEPGGFRPLPSQAILAQNTNRQAKAFSLAKANLTSESAEVVRSTTESANNSSLQSRQTEAAQTARGSAASTSAAATVDNAIGGDQAKSTHNENRSGENPGNSGNNENRGNSGNKENRGNSGNNENRGNSGNNENRGNSGNNENRGNSGNNENRGNSGNNENPGNSGNKENPGNSGNNENRGNSGNKENPGNRAR
jgi:FecR protein